MTTEVGVGQLRLNDLPQPRNEVFMATENQLALRIEFNEAVLARIKRLPKRQYDREKKIWLLEHNEENLTALDAILENVHAYEGVKITWSPQAQIFVEHLRKEAKALSEASKATSADLHIPDLNGELMPFQKAGVKYAIRTRQCIIGDEMGLGKTVQAIAAIQAMEAYPALIVCPASLKLNWAIELGSWLPKKHGSITLINGDWGKDVEVTLKDGKKLVISHNKWDSDILIINYDMLKKHEAKLVEMKFKAIVFDESHKIKNPDAKRTRIALRLSRNIPVRLLLTGTVVVNRPIELVTQLDAVGHLRTTFGGEWAFMGTYCVAQYNGYGWEYTGAKNTEMLHEMLRSHCYVRRVKEDVLKELPDKRRTIIPLVLSNQIEYARAERDVVAWIADRAEDNADFQDSIALLTPEQRREAIHIRRSSASYSAARAEALVKIAVLKRLSAQGKMGAVIEWVEDLVESGEKVIIFAHHVEIQNALLENLKKFNPVAIGGSTSLEGRQKAVETFQNDASCKVFVGSLAAAGVGITLTAASTVAFVELGWTPADHNQAEDRAHRISQKNAVNAYYFVGERTIDEDILELIENKRRVVDAITDGVPVDQHQSILRELLERLRMRA